MIQRSSGRHPAAINLLTLLVLPLLLLLAGLVFRVGLARSARTEVQNGADAAALAAARELATDELLVPGAGGRAGRARETAARLAAANLAAGEQLRLRPNPDNAADGDLVLGHLDIPLGTFTPVSDRDPQVSFGTRLNAVRVTARGPGAGGVFGDPGRDTVARATAMLDFAVVGFRPTTDDPIPLIPVGVFTDHRGESPQSWDNQVAHSGTDEWTFDPRTGQFVPGADGIPEVAVMIGRRESGHVPAVFLQVGVGTFRETAEQCRVGVRRGPLEAGIGGAFVLGPANIVRLPGSPDCPPVGTASRRLIEDAFDDVRRAGLPRIWPLFSDTDDSGTVQVNGWMAARLVRVEDRDGALTLTLQPAVLHHPAAVTERRSNQPAFWANNRTICRVRLAE